ncbi:hypothetical protein [Cellulosilyticum lentocellum]
MILFASNTMIEVNGNHIINDVESQIIDNVTCVPLRVVTESLDSI